MFMGFKFEWLLAGGSRLVANGRSGSGGKKGRENKSTHGSRHGKRKPEGCNGTCPEA